MTILADDKSILIAIDAGVVTQSTDPGLLGTYRYFVSVLADGGELCLWDGPERADALIKAQEAKASWEASDIVDRSRPQ